MRNLSLKNVLCAFALITMAAPLPIAKAQIVNSESFDGTTFPPTGWSITGGGQSQWVRRTTGTNPVCNTHSGAAMARFTAFMQPTSQEQMTTPVINYSGASGSTPTFSLWVYRDNSSTAGDSVTILVNTANSLTGAVRIGAVARSRFLFLPVNETANGWYNYTFNVPNTFTTDTNYIILNGTSHGGGNVYVDDVQWTEFPAACASPLIAGNAIANDTLICSGGGSTTLFIDGSSASSGGLTFQWQQSTSATGPWTNFGANANTISSGALASSTYFRCYIDCSNGGASDTSTVAYVGVNTGTPPVITTNVGPTINYCAGSTPLDFVASGALTYVWNPNVAINTIGDSAQASPTTNTLYTVTGFDSVGCSGSATILVNVSPSPNVNAIVNNDTICSGQTVNLQSAVVGGSFGHTFVWQPGNLTGQGQQVTPTITTMYVVVATNNNSGCSGTDSVLVVVNPSPTAAFTFTFNNLTYNFTNTSSGATSYLWNFGDGNTDTTQNPVHTYSVSGPYTVTLTVSNGMCTATYTQQITVVSVNEFFANGSVVQVYPNPVSDFTVIEFYNDAPTIKLNVFNLTGQIVLEKTVVPVSGNNYKINLELSHLTPGSYLLQFNTDTECAAVRIVKE